MFFNGGRCPQRQKCQGPTKIIMQPLLLWSQEPDWQRFPWAPQPMVILLTLFSVPVATALCPSHLTM